jgi:hypothetical protein
MQSSTRTRLILATSLMSTGLFVLVGSLGLGMAFLFLCTLPILTLGLHKQHTGDRQAPWAAAFLSGLGISALAGPMAGGVYLAVYGLPSAMFCHFVRRWHHVHLVSQQGEAHLRLWYPVGLAMLQLAVYGCAAMALLALTMSYGDTSLPQTIVGSIEEQVKEMKEQYGVSLIVDTQQLAFMVCGFMGWMWGMMLWLHAMLAHRMLARKEHAERPHLFVTPFPLPAWLLSLLAICALASLIASPTLAFLGKACLLLLMLPYAFLGASLMHHASQTWPNRKFFLIFIYGGIVVMFWPAFILCGMGFWHHLKNLNKHLPDDRTSSRS